MENKLVKIMSVLLLTVLGVMLSACGSNKTVEVEQDKYVYTSSFQKINLDIENGYATAFHMDKDNLSVVTAEYDPNDYEKIEYKLHYINLSTREDKAVAISGIEKECYVQDFKTQEDGSVLLLLNKYVAKNDTYEDYYFLNKIDAQGKIVSSIDISEAVKDDSGYVSDFLFAKDGNLYVTVDSSVKVISEDGKVLFNKGVGEWINEIFEDAEGKVYIRYYGNGAGYETKCVDLEKKDIGPAVADLPDDGEIVPGLNGNYISLTGTGAYLYDTATKTQEKLFTWIDTDIENYSAETFIACEDGSYKMLIQDYSGDKVKIEIVTFTKGLRGKSDKKIIKYGCFYLDYDVKEKIIAFNKSNSDYRIEVESFADDSNYDDYEANLKAFDMAILEKGRFDIVDLSNIDNNEKYAKKGVLEDLNSLLKKDPDISREDLFESVLDAYEVDGHLYQISPFFSVQALMGNGDKLKNVDNWNTEALLKLRKENPDCMFMDYMTKENALGRILLECIGDFINSETGDCNFQSEDFYNICEFANSFPDKLSDEDYDEWALIQSGDIILSPLYMNSVGDVEIYSQLYGDNMKLVGFPSRNGSRYALYSNSSIAISAYSKNKDAAWEFIRYFFEEDYQIENSYNGFPLLKSAFDAKMKDEMTINTYVDENGQVQKQMKGGWGNGSTMLYYYGASESTVNQIRDIIDNVSSGSNYDEQVYKIIMEEIAAYFNGSKSKEDVASIIQSRVKIYLAENM